MGRIFLWFYCLPIPKALVLVLLGTGLFLLLRQRLGTWTRLGLVLAWLGVILLGTLRRSPGGDLSEPVLTIFASYREALSGGNVEIYRTNFMNAVLFYPGGLFGCATLPRQWKPWQRVLLVTLSFALLSAGIELAQYRFGLGLVEVDDVFHNTLGALLGAAACLWNEKRPA